MARRIAGSAQSSAFVCQDAGCQTEGRRFEEAPRLLVTSQQAFQLEPKRVVAQTSLVQKRGAPGLVIFNAA